MANSKKIEEKEVINEEETNKNFSENENINTTESIFKDSKENDAKLAVKALKDGKKIVSGERVKFKCEPVYHALYPNGFESTFQGIHIYLIFDGRTVELPKAVVNFVKMKLEKKAMAEINKKVRNQTKKQEYLGMEYVG
jgi:hypothetical protein